MIESALLIGLVVVALAIIGLVLLQQGKGADMGASFGSGASQTLFGSQGSGNFLTRSTWVLAFVFFGLCLALAWIARDKAESAGKIDFGTPAVVEEVPVVDSEIPAVEDEAATESDIPQVEVETEQAELPQVEESVDSADEVPEASEGAQAQ